MVEQSCSDVTNLAIQQFVLSHTTGLNIILPHGDVVAHAVLASVCFCDCGVDTATMMLVLLVTLVLLWCGCCIALAKLLWY